MNSYLITNNNQITSKRVRWNWVRFSTMRLAIYALCLTAFFSVLGTTPVALANTLPLKTDGDEKVSVISAQINLCQLMSVDIKAKRAIIKLPNGRLALVNKGREIPGTNTVITQVLAEKIQVAIFNQSLEAEGYQGYLLLQNNGVSNMVWLTRKSQALPVASTLITTEISAKALSPN